MVIAVTKEARGEAVIAFTDRVKKRKEEYLGATAQLCAERSHIFTDYWRKSEGEPLAIRRAKAFEKVVEGISIAIREGELVVGSPTKYVRGCFVYPEISSEWIIKELRSSAELFASGEAVKCVISDDDRRAILEDCEYWKDRSVLAKAQAIEKERWGSLIEDACEARMYQFPYNSSLLAVRLDYPKVLSKGLHSVIAEAGQKLANHQIVTTDDLQKRYFWEAVIIACQAAIKLAGRYARVAREMATQEANPERKRELEKIAEICDWVPANPARSFYEAVQSFWLIVRAGGLESGGVSYGAGRFDQHMYPFYKRDIEEGRMTPSEAAELLGCLWVKCAEIEQFRDEGSRKRFQGTTLQNWVIGGQTRDGKDATNELSYLILEVVRQVKTIQPTVSLRYHDGLPEDFLLKAVEVNRDYGGGQPAWFNDKAALINLPHMGVPLYEARDWVPQGCVERSIPGASWIINYGLVSLAKVLELTLNNGVDPRTGKQLGPATGDPRGFSSFEELYEAYKRQLAYWIELQVNHVNLVYSLYPFVTPNPFNSALLSDCIEKGKDLAEGGLRWKQFPAVMPHGHQNTANSLVAIKKLVYEDKAISMEELLEVLAVNFEGKERLHAMLLAAPKYGNDDDYADEMMNEIFKLTRELITQHTNWWGERVAVTRQGHSAHYSLGQTIGALPDGRRAYEPTADGSLSAFRGTDKKGPTAVLNSAGKIDAIDCMATLLNLKFHPSALQGRDGQKKLLALIKTYFDRYGHHVQFNMLSRETLLDAKKHPEKYRDLIVRVAGFSALFVELAPEVQDEIIARTEQWL